MNVLPEVKVYWGHKKADQKEFMQCLEACTIPDDVFSYVGFAASPDFEQAVPIIIEDGLLRQLRTLFAGAMLCGIDGKDYIIIALNDRFYAELRKNERLEAIIDHELGHICCGHLDNRTLEQVNKERDAKQLIGEVFSDELEADQFAVRRCKKPAVVYALRYMINHMDRYFDERDVAEKWRQAAKQEVENRLRLVNKMA